MKGKKQPRMGQGLKRVQILLFDWQVEPFRKLCNDNGLSVAEGIRILVSGELNNPVFEYESASEIEDLHFETRKKIWEEGE